MSVYNLLGKEVVVLVDEEEAAGIKTVRWEGLDATGAEVASGIYLVRFEVTSKGKGAVFRQVRKMMYVH